MRAASATQSAQSLELWMEVATARPRPSCNQKHTLIFLRTLDITYFGVASLNSVASQRSPETRPRKNRMTKSITFVLGIVFALTTWLAADKNYHPSTTLEMVTSFDFADYPACRPSQSSCIRGIRFYDADSGQRLADAPVDESMVGRRKISARTHVSSIPRGVYAVTVYLDSTGQIKEGHPGEVSRFRSAAQ